jgi:hypothetical protein
MACLNGTNETPEGKYIFRTLSSMPGIILSGLVILSFQ